MAKHTFPHPRCRLYEQGDTFARIAAYAAYKLQVHARTLYGALADKKRIVDKH